MKMKDYSISVRESARYVLRDSEPADMSGYVATGRTQEWNFTGDFDALLVTFEEMLAEGTCYRQRQCVLTRQEGGMAELVVTETEFRAAGDDSGGGGGEDLSAGGVGKSAANPLYEYSFSETAEPMLTHPLIAGVWGDKGSSPNPDVMGALQFLAQGGMDNGILYLSDGSQSDVKTYLNHEGVSQTVQEMVRIPSFIDIRTRLTVSYEVAPDEAVAGKMGATHVVKQPPGPLVTPAGREWLFVGGGFRKQGEKVWYSEVYLLSGPTGWDDTVYEKTK